MNRHEVHRTVCTHTVGRTQVDKNRQNRICSWLGLLDLFQRIAYSNFTHKAGALHHFILETQCILKKMDVF